MDLPVLYSEMRRMDSFSEYRVPRAYEQITKQVKSVSQLPKHKKSVFVEMEEKAKEVPGVGKYIINPEPEQPKKAHKKIDFKILQQSIKATYIDDILKVKKGIPDIGKYQTEKDHTEEIRKKYKLKNDARRKKAPLFRPTALDQANPDTARIGPGDYETLRVKME